MSKPIMLTARQRRLLQKIGGEVWYHLLNFYLIPIWLLERLFHWALVRNNVMGQFRHILINDSTFDSNPHFLQVTLDALALIEKYDARRLRRVLKEVRFINSDHMNAFGNYRRFQRTCAMNFRSISMDWDDKEAPEYTAHYEWWVAYYASCIVHEATHGRMDSLGFTYNKKSRKRIERICVAEQRRFATRMPSKCYDFAKDLVAPYNPGKWERYWNPTRQQQWQEVREAFQEIHVKKPRKVHTADLQTESRGASVLSVVEPVELPLLSRLRKRRK